MKEGGRLAARRNLVDCIEGALLEQRCQPPDGFDEVEVECLHREVDWVEVHFTEEAAAKVRPRVDDGDQFSTTGTLEC